MKLVDRGFITVTPSERFQDWVKNTSEELFLCDSHREASCYLIEEEFWEEEKLLEKYFKKICRQEFFPVSQDSDTWPRIENIQDFKSYFSIEIGSFVYDLLSKDIKKEIV